MLPERVFALGGWLSIVAGGLLLVAFVENPAPVLCGILPAGVFLLGFGVFFLYVGRGSARDRRRLLETPRRPG
ncbi:MAG: hypothetical protein L3K14_10120 [Thermoplasmata archaeon]|nr:hypothetical protein [Thermoplasmata archaeon]